MKVLVLWAQSGPKIVWWSSLAVTSGHTGKFSHTAHLRVNVIICCWIQVVAEQVEPPAQIGSTLD